MADESKYPTRIAPYGLRMPDDLKARVQAAAEANNRSMNAEIVAALDEKFPISNEVEVNFPPDLLADLDAYRATLPDDPSRPEAIREIIRAMLHIVKKDR